MRSKKKAPWDIDVSQLTPGGWVVSLVSVGIAVASVFLVMGLVPPTTPAMRSKGAGVVLAGVLAIAFGISLGLGTLILNLCGLTFKKQDAESLPNAWPKLVVHPLVVQLTGLLLGSLGALVLGLLFNTGTTSAPLEIGIYIGVGAIAGWYAGRLLYIVLR